MNLILANLSFLNNSKITIKTSTPRTFFGFSFFPNGNLYGKSVSAVLKSVSKSIAEAKSWGYVKLKLHL
jgi:hypothetical protein